MKRPILALASVTVLAAAAALVAVVAVASSGPPGAAADHTGDKMYWADAGKAKIQRANLNGSSVEDLVTSGLDRPIRIALDIVNTPHKMYWTDGGTDKIQRANLDGTNVEDRLTGPSDRVGLALDLVSTPQKMYWTDFLGSKIKRANLNGTSEELLVTTLCCPVDIALDVGAGEMYWTLRRGVDKIQRATLAGNDVTDLLTAADGLSDPRGIALDLVDDMMYWVDNGTNKIQRANLNGSSVEDLVTSGLSLPIHIALDVIDGKMYWTDAGTVKIQRANLNGSSVEDLVTAADGLMTPVGIALGPDHGPPVIEKTLLEGPTETTTVATTITFDACSGAPPSYSESGLTVISGQLRLLCFNFGGDPSNDLLNAGGCCFTPYTFSFGGAPFDVVSLDVVADFFGSHTFTSSDGAVETPVGIGTHTFPAAGWTGITSFRWDETGQMSIDNLVIEVESEELSKEIGIYLPEPTRYVFEIAYAGPTAAKVIDTVPAEFECVGDPVATAGTATCSDTSKGEGNSANRIEWDVPAGSNTLSVTIQTIASPGKGHAKKGETVFKPTSCGSLPINDGATAFGVDPVTGELVLVEVVDPVTGEITLEPVVIVGPSNSLVVEAVEGAKPCEEG